MYNMDFFRAISRAPVFTTAGHSLLLYIQRGQFSDLVLTMMFIAAFS